MHTTAIFIPMASLRTAALPLFRFKGIQVLVHWSFFLLIGWVVFSSLSKGTNLNEVAFNVGKILILFCCVVLHEFGHALTALHYGVGTKNIMLLPIGGVASLERMPEEPKQELLITLAGPAVNLVIMLFLGVPLWLYLGSPALPDVVNAPTASRVLGFVVLVNLGLLLFNLIPAFPMDGGRILRSLLSMRMDRVKATHIATLIGRTLAVVFVLAGLSKSQPMWVLIGAFVFFGATMEYRQVLMQQALKGLHVRNVLRTRFWSLPHTATLQQATDGLLAGGDHHLLVLREGRFDRLLKHDVLLAAGRDIPGTTMLDQLPGVIPPTLGPEVDVRHAYDLLATGEAPLLPVVERGTLIGIVELDNLTEYLTLKGLVKEP
jgi:Zn-dependent protease